MATKFFAVGLALGALALTGCQQTDTTDQAPNVLQIATEGAYAPFNYTQKDGSLAGFDVDLTHALCQQMQTQCQITAQEWDGIIPALKAGKYDAIISAMSITPERSEQVSFSQPYFDNHLVFIAKKDSDFHPDDPQKINTAKVAAQNSTISSQWFTAHYPNNTPNLYSTLDGAFLDLGSGRVDVVVSDRLPALQWLDSDIGADFAIKGSPIDINDKFAIAVNTDQPQLLDKFNQALTQLKTNGTYDELISKHFGKNAVIHQP